MLKFIDKNNIQVTEKDLQIKNKSMQLYGEIKILQELLENKEEIDNVKNKR